MFQVDWAQRRIWETEDNIVPAEKESVLNRKDVRHTALLYWEEHCVECAIPACYSSCSLYISRADKRCARFAYGIYPNPHFQGLLDYGADIRFRRWAKLETRVFGKSVTVDRHRRLDRFNRSIITPGIGAGRHGYPLQPSFADGDAFVSVKSIFERVRNKYFFTGWSQGDNVLYDEFVIECFSPEPDSFRLMLEHFDQELTVRHSFLIEPGWNFHTLPGAAFRFTSGPSSCKITVAPENDEERRLIITWLDLVNYEPAHRPTAPTVHTPANKVKCVAWDLDNTLWEGILAEDSETSLKLRLAALALVKNLDERGILQTIVSKNNFNDAWSVIERLGLQDYFLYPAINWRTKSSNLARIAQKLNINLDTFALIDDSSFERAEVQTSLPQVRVYAETEISRLLMRDEFDVPISSSTKHRRVSYLTEIKRDEQKEAFAGDYDAFLRSCKMKLRVFVPREQSHISRCLELIQRANQLNLSTRRYTAEEFGNLLSSDGVLCLAMECTDRFGAYGIVGFASVDESGSRPTLHDLVLSCRVAQKKVEHAFIQWLARRERARAGKVLVAMVVASERNQPIRQVFDDFHFRSVGERNGTTLMELDLDGTLASDGIVTIEAELELSIPEKSAVEVSQNSPEVADLRKS
jgi:FkbH-like protein